MTRSALRELVDRLPEQDIESVTQLIIAYESGDRLTIAQLLAPEVDPKTDEVEALLELDERPDLAQIVSMEQLRTDLRL